MDYETHSSYERDERESETEREWDEQESKDLDPVDDMNEGELKADGYERDSRIYDAIIALKSLSQSELEAVLYDLPKSKLTAILRAMPDYDAD